MDFSEGNYMQRFFTCRLHIYPCMLGCMLASISDCLFIGRSSGMYQHINLVGLSDLAKSLSSHVVTPVLGLRTISSKSVVTWSCCLALASLGGKVTTNATGYFTGCNFSLTTKISWLGQSARSLGAAKLGPSQWLPSMIPRNC